MEVETYQVFWLSNVTSHPKTYWLNKKKSIILLANLQFGKDVVGASSLFHLASIGAAGKGLEKPLPRS